VLHLCKFAELSPDAYASGEEFRVRGPLKNLCVEGLNYEVFQNESQTSGTLTTMSVCLRPKFRTSTLTLRSEGKVIAREDLDLESVKGNFEKLSFLESESGSHSIDCSKAALAFRYLSDDEDFEFVTGKSLLDALAEPQNIGERFKMTLGKISMQSPEILREAWGGLKQVHVCILASITANRLTR
jgi:hypothetical protein